MDDELRIPPPAGNGMTFRRQVSEYLRTIFAIQTKTRLQKPSQRLSILVTLQTC